MKKFKPVNEKVKGFLHGGDYNPDQWLDYPEVLKEDVRLLKLAHCNCVSINIFGWSAIEPEEGVYTFEWLDKVMDDMAEAGSSCNIIYTKWSKASLDVRKVPRSFTSLVR